MSETRIDSFGQIRTLIGDLFHIRPMVYWTDFTLTMIVAWGSFWMAFQTASMGLKGLLLCLSTLAFFRGLIFVHEIAHLRGKALPGFRWAWNALCGMMFFLPGYMYSGHSGHHRIASFSTIDDPEYIPVAYQHPLEILAPLVVFAFVPLVLALRSLLVCPISLAVGGRFRELLLRHASTLKMNLRFEWRNISEDDQRESALQDVLCIGWWAVFLFLCAWTGEWQILWHWYLIMYGILAINHVRNLAEHRFINVAGEKVNFEAQLLDSVTVTGFSPLASILLPVGLRYHSIHHMFPTLPYHALRQAEKRLAQALPKDHFYFETLEPTFSVTMLHFVKSVQAHQVARPS